MAGTPDVVVVGGGVIGCGIAYALASAKAKVLLLEKEQVGSGASHASAGMVAPLSDSREKGPLLDLGMKSFRMCQPFLREVEEASGMDVECLPSGIIRVAMTEEEAAELKGSLELAKRLGLELRWLDGHEARKLEPLLGPSVLAATYSPEEPQLNPSRLVEALRRAAAAHGATFREQSPVLGLTWSNSRVVGVRVGDEAVAAGAVVLAMGSWACHAGEWLGLNLPVRPVRGQVAYVNKLAKPLQHTVMHGMSYAVPKGDGTTLVGTTVERVGFDQRVTVGGLAFILGKIQGLVPSIAEATVNHTRAGLRPWFEGDRLPVLGPAPGADNVIIAAGHHRSGILLTPITARMVADLLVKGPRSVELAPYSAARLEKQRK